jgi:hypothetical protein
VVPAAAQQVVLDGQLRALLPPLSISSLYQTLTTTMLLTSGELTPETQHNDTVRTTADLSHYYAADDGSPELVLSYRAAGVMDPVAVATPYETNTPDQVAGVEIYIAGDLPTGTRLFADVWADDNGVPAATPLSRVSFVVPADSVLRRLKRWYPVWFAPVSVSGRFYVGYGQPNSTSIVNIGVDLSGPLARSGRLYTRARTDPWRADTLSAAVMVRALMNFNGVLGRAEEVAAADFTVYPNPLSISGSAATLHLSRPAAAPLLLRDGLGRMVRTAPAGATALPVQGLAPGVYVLQSAASVGGRAVRVVLTQ